MRLRRPLAALAAAVLVACAEQPASPAAPGEEPFFAASAEPARLAIVLSSGALRGLAHVGVLRALEAEGIRPDLIVGSSVGALVGAINASGVPAADIGRIVAADDFDFGSDWLASAIARPRLSVYQFTQKSLMHQRVERFPVRYAAVVTDLRKGCMEVFNGGGAALAVQASTGLPGVFAATKLAGRDYADGAMSSPLPVRAARELGAQRVIAIDVTYPPAESKLEGMVDRLFQIGLVMTHSLASQEAQEADLVIRPSFPAESSVNLANRAALMAVGDDAVRRALPEIRRLLLSPAPAHVPRRTDARRCAGLITAGR